MFPAGGWGSAVPAADECLFFVECVAVRLHIVETDFFIPPRD